MSTCCLLSRPALITVHILLFAAPHRRRSSRQRKQCCELFPTTSSMSCQAHSSRSTLSCLTWRALVSTPVNWQNSTPRPLSCCRGSSGRHHAVTGDGFERGGWSAVLPSYLHYLYIIRKLRSRKLGLMR
ncbi:hypothetical protein V5799_013520 [Amblyomma americanum]|uniref:Uncharacterized protein n=1 Tax=Amblyomma americanum TaxID=6943 RepID=A0AAQ4E5N0_AMBAM